MEITPLEGNPSSAQRGWQKNPPDWKDYLPVIFIFKFKLGEIENETNLKQKKKPISSKTGLRRILMGLKGNRSRKRHLKSRFCDTLEDFPTVKTGKKIVKLVLLLKFYSDPA